MGQEATCTGTLDGRSASGKALLETTELVFRGGEVKARIPLARVKAAEVDGERLVVRFGAQVLSLALGGAVAARWADKIRNPPSRLDKLGVKPGTRVALVGSLDADFVRELDRRGAAVTAGLPRAGAEVEVLFYAADARPDLERLAALRARIVPHGAVWVVRPKGSAAITEREVMAAGKTAGMVDVKVASFSATHTAEKFVIPLAARAGAAAAASGAPAMPAVKPARATAKNPRPRPSTSAAAKNRPRPARARARRA